MRLSQPRISRGRESGGEPGILSAISLGGVTEMLALRGSGLTAEAALAQWSGATFANQVERHAQLFALPIPAVPDEFLAVAYTRPDMHIANMLGCQLASRSLQERSIVGVTAHGAGTVHELLTLLAATSFATQRGRLWILDQYSPFPVAASRVFAGTDAVCTFEINGPDSHWIYEETTSEESPADSKQSGVEVTNTDTDRSDGEEIIESWIRLSASGDNQDLPVIVSDIDPTLGVTWTTRLSWDDRNH